VISCIVVAIQHPERPQGTLKQASGSDRTERLSAVSAGPNGTLRTTGGEEPTGRVSVSFYSGVLRRDDG